MHLFKAAILLYQSSLKRKTLKLKERQLFYLVIKLKKTLLYQRLVRDEKLREVWYHSFFELIIMLLLIIIVIVSTKNMIPIPLLVSHLAQAFGKAKGFVNLIASQTTVSLSIS